MDSQSNIIQLVEALGLDYEKIRDAAEGMDPEEFEQRLMQELTGAVQKMGLDEYVEHKLETKEQKMQALKDVFGIGEITEADLEGVERTIEFGWMSDCVLDERLEPEEANNILKENLELAEKKQILEPEKSQKAEDEDCLSEEKRQAPELEKSLESEGEECSLEEDTGAEKNQALAEALDSAEKELGAEKNKVLSEDLNPTEEEFLEACKGWIERGEAVYLENFPFSVEMLLGLIEKDLMDVKYISSKKEMILSLQLARNFEKL